MARAARSRAAAASYPKPSSSTSSARHELPTPLYTDRSTANSPAPAPATTASAPTPFHQPVPTPPYSSTEEFPGANSLPHYPQPGGLMPPPTIYPGQAMPMPVQHPHSSPITLPDHFGSSPGFGSSVSPQQIMQPTGSHHNLHPHSHPSAGSYFPEGYYLGNIDPYLVHDPTASRPPTAPGFSSPHEEMASYFQYGPPPVTPAAVTSKLTESRDSKNSMKIVHAPRPPNAWILYRSDKLKAIAAGSEVPGLDDVMAELGVSSSDSGDEQVQAGGDDLPTKPKAKKKKVKKGAKEPTEGILSLGKGKTGRGLSQADISKMISMLWRRESATVRAEYERQSEMKKAEHAAMYPGYKFQPLRKADKIKIKEEKERKKEAARREKELQKSGGGRRRPRTRNRLSPNAPYSVLEGPRGLSRSLTYSGHTSTTEDSMRDGYGSLSSMPVTPGDTFDEHKFRSYPFPMPSSSLPSMGPDDVGVPYDVVIPLPTESIPVPPPAPSISAPHTSAPMAAAMPDIRTPQPSQHNSPAPRQGQTPRRVPSTPSGSQPPLRPSMSPMPQTPAPPLRHGQQPPAGVYDVENTYASYRGVDPEDLDAHDIVALWCSKEDDEAGPRTVAHPAPQGGAEHPGSLPRVVQDALNYDGVPDADRDQIALLAPADTSLLPELSQQQTFEGLELRTLAPPMYPGGWIQVPVPDGHVPADPNDPQTHLYAPEDALVFDGHAYAYTTGVRPDGSIDLPVLWAGDDTAMGPYSSNMHEDFYLAFENDGPSRGLVPLEAMIVEETGPFLSEAALFSPTDAEWTLRPAPLNAVIYEQSPGGTHGANTPNASTAAAPRHISSSSFPLTPQSADGSLPGVNGSWNDRATSFAFANGIPSSFDIGIGEDMMVWGDDEDEAPAPATRPRVLSKSPAAFFDIPEAPERPETDEAGKAQAVAVE